MGEIPVQVWIAPGTGVAEDFVNVLKDLSSNSEVVMVAIFAIFALIHSGLAYLRPWGDTPPPPSHLLPIAYISYIYVLGSC